MKILLCPSAYYPHIGGVEELTYRLAVEYKRQGHIVQILTSRWPLNLPSKEEVQGFEVNRLDFVMPRKTFFGILHFLMLFPFRLINLMFLIRRLNPDIVHIQCISVQGFYILALKKILRFRLIVTLQGERRMDANQIFQKSKLMEPMLKILLRTADKVTACSQATLDDVYDLWPEKNKGLVIPNGISLDEFETEDINSNYLFSEPFIFATGRHVHNKGFDILIKAFSQLEPIYPNVRLVIGGNGSENINLKKLAEKEGLNGKVYFPGFLSREQTVTYFRNCLFFVLPSRYEPFGIVNLEAMAAKKAIIAFDTGGVKELVESEVNGLLLVLSSNSIVHLADAIKKLLDNKWCAESMGRKGRTRVETFFCWEIIANMYLRIYQSDIQVIN